MKSKIIGLAIALLCMMMFIAPILAIHSNYKNWTVKYNDGDITGNWQEYNNAPDHDTACEAYWENLYSDVYDIEFGFVRTSHILNISRTGLSPYYQSVAYYEVKSMIQCGTNNDCGIILKVIPDGNRYNMDLEIWVYWGGSGEKAFTIQNIDCRDWSFRLVASHAIGEGKLSQTFGLYAVSNDAQPMEELCWGAGYTPDEDYTAVDAVCYHGIKGRFDTAFGRDDLFEVGVTLFDIGTSGDFDGSGEIDIYDQVMLTAAYGKDIGEVGIRNWYLDGNYWILDNFVIDEEIDIFDIVSFVAKYRWKF